MTDIVDTNQIFLDAKRLGKTPYKVTSLSELGISSPSDFSERMESLHKRAITAFDNECYIEYLSLMLLHIEIWLRIYLKGKGEAKGLNIYSDRVFFGELIRTCANAGMDQVIVDELKFINGWRIDYVHSYLKKSFDYSALLAIKPRISKIPPQLMLYVARDIGKIVKDASEIGSPGEIVLLL
jgi:hypothetical protein